MQCCVAFVNINFKGKFKQMHLPVEWTVEVKVLENKTVELDLSQKNEIISHGTMIAEATIDFNPQALENVLSFKVVNDCTEMLFITCRQCDCEKRMLEILNK